MTIDWWTLGIQTVNIVILVWLLQRFFWRPVAAMIEQRRAGAEATLADAAAKAKQATAALAEIDKTRAGFTKEHDAILLAAHATAETASAATLAKAGRDAAALEAAGRETIRKAGEAADKAWTERANHLAVDIAQRLAARLDGPTVRAAFLDWLLQKIRAMPEAERRAMAANGGTLEGISATPLDPADQDRYRTLIGQAMGTAAPIAFTADPALIAGLELRAPHLVVSNSWRADLGQIMAELPHAP